MSTASAILAEFDEANATEEAIMDRYLLAIKLMLQQMRQDDEQIRQLQQRNDAALADIMASLTKR